MKRKLIQGYSLMMAYIANLSNTYAQYEEAYYVDEEDYQQSQQWSNFKFDNFEIGMIILGIILLAISIPKMNNKDKGSEPGCAYIGMFIFGIICISPVISGVLTLIGKIVGEVVRLGLFVALIAGGIYLISSIFKKD
jgi:hypothetical protein